MLRRACTEAKRWEACGWPSTSRRSSSATRIFVANVIRIIQETDFDPTRLELELTEGVLIEDADAAEAAMMDMRAHGVGLALDDFGSRLFEPDLSAPLRLRQDQDRPLLPRIHGSDRRIRDPRALDGASGPARSACVSAQKASRTAEQHRFLQAIGCHELQGFLFSRACRPPRSTACSRWTTPSPKRFRRPEADGELANRSPSALRCSPRRTVRGCR